jgi:hypothetical protein
MLLLLSCTRRPPPALLMPPARLLPADALPAAAVKVREPALDTPAGASQLLNRMTPTPHSSLMDGTTQQQRHTGTGQVS